jgi:hypothetical protein
LVKGLKGDQHCAWSTHTGPSPNLHRHLAHSMRE